MNEEVMTDTNPTPLPLRNDTILGVCEAIGQDFGFNPLWLRLAFIAPLFFQPVWTVAAYLLLGAVVALSRYFAPRPIADEVVTTSAGHANTDAAQDMKIAA
ncbi:PspC domain-containing protein [Sphingomonas mesophila]|uniref:PspC domain-containing protein n=1 Tax=Sphingomonas mesophila TaxID=2303576 RepID=UPI001F07A4E2|nr:PspC domain-containing protein [Sphingomonas mesophila]